MTGRIVTHPDRPGEWMLCYCVPRTGDLLPGAAVFTGSLFECIRKHAEIMAEKPTIAARPAGGADEEVAPDDR